MLACPMPLIQSDRPETLVDAYQAVRHRLPAAQFPAQSQRFDNLAPLTDAYDAFLFDAFGVLNVGERAIPTAIQRLAALQAMGKRVLVVSNAASVPKAVLAEKYQGLGFNLSAADIITSRDALLAGLKFQPRGSWGVMAPQMADLSDLPGEVHWLLDDERAYERVEGFILLAAAGWTESRQARLVDALRKKPRAVWVANPDLVAPREYGLSIEPGTHAHALENVTDVQARYFGKPFPEIFRLAAVRLGPDIAPERVLMVGDTLHTDILGGCAAGFDTALVVEHGVSQGLELSAATRRTGIVPHHVLRHI